MPAPNLNSDRAPRGAVPGPESETARKSPGHPLLLTRRQRCAAALWRPHRLNRFGRLCLELIGVIFALWWIAAADAALSS